MRNDTGSGHNNNPSSLSSPPRRHVIKQNKPSSSRLFLSSDVYRLLLTLLLWLSILLNVHLYSIHYINNREELVANHQHHRRVVSTTTTKEDFSTGKSKSKNAAASADHRRVARSTRKVVFMDNNKSSQTTTSTIPLLPRPTLKKANEQQERLMKDHRQSINSAVAKSNMSTPPQVPVVVNDGQNHHDDDDPMSLLYQNANQSIARLPEQWMKDYIVWHQKESQSFRHFLYNDTRSNNNNNAVNGANSSPYDWSQHKYLIVRCLHRDSSCGGFADRLRALPFILLLAAKSQRLLFFYWERPALLEAFLEPVTLDWRVPPPLVPQIISNDRNCPFRLERQARNTKMRDVDQKLLQSTKLVEDLRFQAYSEAAKYYGNATNRHPSLSSSAAVLSTSHNSMTLMDEHLGPLWRALFRPIPRIRQALEAQWTQQHLIPGQYMAVHSRTLYTADLSQEQSSFTSAIENAIECAAVEAAAAASINTTSTTRTLLPNANATTRTDSRPKILFASDSRHAKDVAIQYGQGQVVTASIDDSKDDKNDAALHFDRGTSFLTPNNRTTLANNQQRAAAAAAAAAVGNAAEDAAAPYHSVLVDLYLLACARCVAYDRGGFGKFAAILSYNPACQFNHNKRSCRRQRKD